VRIVVTYTIEGTRHATLDL